MPFKDLETKPLAEYLAAERTKPGDFWFFLHIPKTAGSSFSNELSSRLVPYKNIHADYENSDVPHDVQMSNAVNAFIASHNAKNFASASGHVPYDLAANIKAGIPQTKLITFLRSPEARVISDYRYQRTPMHPPYLKFIEEFPDLESYVSTRGAQNKMARFMMGRSKDIDEEELIAHVGQNFSFIGLLEMYPMSFNIAFDLMGHEGLGPSEHKRKTPNTKDTEVHMTEELRNLIRKSNKLDQALYDYVRSVLFRRREEWINAGK